MAFATTIGTTKYNIETNTVSQNNLIVRNNVVKSDGDDASDEAAQFFIDTGTDNVNAKNLLYRFRPVSQPKKYLAALGSNIILKDVPQTTIPTDSSHDFYVTAVPEDGDYVKYLYRYSSVNSLLYISTDVNDDVILDGDSPNAWFRLREAPINNTAATTLTASVEDYFEGFELSEKVYIEATNSNAKDESFYGKIVVRERMSITEE